MKHFPKWKYSIGKSVVVENEEEESALRGEWFDLPSQLQASLDEKAKKIDDELLAKRKTKAEQDALDKEIETLKANIGKDNSDHSEEDLDDAPDTELPDIETLRATAVGMGLTVHPRAGQKKVSDQIKAAIEAKGE